MHAAGSAVTDRVLQALIPLAQASATSPLTSLDDDLLMTPSDKSGGGQLTSFHIQAMPRISESGLVPLLSSSSQWQAFELVHAGAVSNDGLMALADRHWRKISLCHTGDVVDDDMLGQLVTALPQLHTLRLHRHI